MARPANFGPTHLELSRKKMLIVARPLDPFLVLCHVLPWILLTPVVIDKEDLRLYLLSEASVLVGRLKTASAPAKCPNPGNTLNVSAV